MYRDVGFLCCGWNTVPDHVKLHSICKQYNWGEPKRAPHNSYIQETIEREEVGNQYTRVVSFCSNKATFIICTYQELSVQMAHARC